MPQSNHDVEQATLMISHRLLIDHHRIRFTIGDGIVSSSVDLQNLFHGILARYVACVQHLMMFKEYPVEAGSLGSTCPEAH